MCRVPREPTSRGVEHPARRKAGDDDGAKELLPCVAAWTPNSLSLAGRGWSCWTFSSVYALNRSPSRSQAAPQRALWIWVGSLLDFPAYVKMWSDLAQV